VPPEPRIRPATTADARTIAEIHVASRNAGYAGLVDPQLDAPVVGYDKAL
jgi:hypothetical protein